MKSITSRLTKRWRSGDPRPWIRLPFWQWKIRREGFYFWLDKTRLVTDEEFREVIFEEKYQPPEHHNCRCVTAPFEGDEA